MNKDLSFPIKVILNLQKKLDIPLRNKLERGNKKFLLLSRAIACVLNVAQNLLGYPV